MGQSTTAWIEVNKLPSKTQIKRKNVQIKLTVINSIKLLTAQAVVYNNTHFIHKKILLKTLNKNMYPIQSSRTSNAVWRPRISNVWRTGLACRKESLSMQCKIIFFSFFAKMAVTNS